MKQLRTPLMILILCALMTALMLGAHAATLLVDDDGTAVYREVAIAPATIVMDGETLTGDIPAYVTGGRTMVPVRLVAEALSAQVEWIGATRQVRITLDGCEIVLTIGSATALVDGTETELYDGVPATIAYDGTVTRTMVPLRFVAEQLGAEVDWDGESRTVTVTPAQADDAEESDETDEDENEDEESPLDPTMPLVVLDAGHGGSDTGTLGDGLVEKELNLDVTLRVAALLREAGVRVSLTRETDEYVSLADRAEFANALGADIFVSIHTNASNTVETVYGVETYYVPGGVEARILAKELHEAVLAATDADDNKVRTARFYVLRKTDMPAALVEMGYVTNSKELEKMKTDEYRTKLAQGIATGVLNYLKAKSLL
jgi:N-acetylmuramoyl-L-alanine amidase